MQRTARRLLGTLIALAAVAPGRADAQPSFLEFESGPVRPIALSPDGTKLLACNVPDNRLEIFGVSGAGLAHQASVPVGMEPVAVALRNNSEAWVVNHLSDSISIVDLAAAPPRVARTLLVGDEPRDIVFAGTGGNRAFITTAHRGQHRTDPSIAGVIGAGDPQLTTPGVGRADIWVFDAANLGTTFGGTPLRILTFFADTPRALTTDGTKVYVAAFHSGNGTTAVSSLAVCPNFSSSSCNITIPLVPPINLTSPGGLPGPSTNAFGVTAPQTGLIVKFDPASGEWRDTLNRNWDAAVPFDLPDRDVFSVDANTFAVGSPANFPRVGTILFNMVINPTTGRLYVSNTESPNLTRFEGPGVHGGSTVQGHLSEARISVIDTSTGATDAQHLNPHINYSQLFTGGTPPPATQKDHSLATPLQMVVSSTGTVYVAAFGSAKIGVIPATTLEAPSFEADYDPTVESANYIPTGGGPAGLALDEPRGRLYVLTRFDNSVAVIDPATRATLATHALHNPEPASITDGRRFLYDAALTSGNGEASCASCHVFGDNDNLAWDLGNPDDPTTTNTIPVREVGAQPAFHPMKGPMTTQTLRGLATHGAMHWRGDRVSGFFGTDPCTEPSGSPCDEEHSFNNFIAAFEGLVGRDGAISTADMQKFTDFALQLRQPPNPIANLDASLTASQSAGRTTYLTKSPVDGGTRTCNTCHTLNPALGFFGTDGRQTFEGEPQQFKISHLRNVYTKVGMFGSTFGTAATGDQIRGYGVLHDGTIDRLRTFVSSPIFNLTSTEELNLEQFMLAFPADLAPIVGQQVTLTSTNAAVAGPRIDFLIENEDDPFDSLILGGSVSECDLIAKGVVGGAPRGWFREASGQFRDDRGSLVSDAALRAFATSDGPVTYTCAPPGSGVRMGIDRDEDTVLDGLDNCAAADNLDQLDTDLDLAGNACDADDDNDGLADAVETNTGTYVGPNNTGTDPLVVDTDGDSFADGVEVAAGSDPTNPASIPGGQGVPALPIGAWVAAVGALAVAAQRVLAARR
jgi:cytochrome c peroxidase